MDETKKTAYNVADRLVRDLQEHQSNDDNFIVDDDRLQRVERMLNILTDLREHDAMRREHAPNQIIDHFVSK